MKIEFMTVQQWIEMYPEIKKQEVKCEECEGEGYIECFSCGHEKECENCNGKGKINDVSSQWHKQNKKDIELLKKLNLYNYN